MRNRFSTVLGSAVVVLTLLYPLSANASEEHRILTPDDVKWGPGPASLPKGAQAVTLYGDSSREGQFALRLKLPAGFHIPPHIHPKQEIVTVLSGTLLLGEGAAAEQGRTTALSAGGFFAMPAGKQHYVYTSEETVLQLNSIGPWNIVYVDQKDDPRLIQ